MNGTGELIRPAPPVRSSWARAWPWIRRFGVYALVAGAGVGWLQDRSLRAADAPQRGGVVAAAPTVTPATPPPPVSSVPRPVVAFVRAAPRVHVVTVAAPTSAAASTTASAATSTPDETTSATPSDSATTSDQPRPGNVDGPDASTPPGDGNAGPGTAQPATPA